MNVRAFLENFRSKNSVNSNEGVNVPLRGSRKPLPQNDFAKVISSFDLYKEERLKCDKIRLTCQVNPICSNILFNGVTEIVKDEGSTGVTFINYGQSRTPDSQLFSNVVYKPKTMSFWKGGNTRYQNKDAVLQEKDPELNIIASDKNQIRNSDLVEIANKNEYHPTNAIRDTQLTRKDSNGDYFVYHCGLDILNNHLIRSNTFKTVCRLSRSTAYQNENSNYTAFNTIADLMRDVSGDKVVEKLCFPVTAGIPNHTKFIPLHLYLYDDILTFEQSKQQRLIKKYNGWVGFNNKSKIKSYNNFQEGDDLMIERPISYMQGGDFVDMYPGRDLYSFVPKFNHFRQRIEKNWNYCITYPSSSTTEGFDDIIDPSNNSMKTIYFDETRVGDNGAKQLVMYSKAKHGLSKGDFVNIYKVNIVDGERIATKILDNAEVDTIVDDFIFIAFTQGVQISRYWVNVKDVDEVTVDGVNFRRDSDSKKYFWTANSRFQRPCYVINDEYANFDAEAQNITYKKVVNDIECDYYVRVFSRLPNFKYASGDTSNEYQIYKHDGDKPSMLEIYQQREYEFENQISRLAFAKNIYTDEVGEVVFTDDIDIANIKDNLGRPLSEIYLTIVKNNHGYKYWYGFDDYTININHSDVEYSHCFGKVTCGFEMSDESIYDNWAYNIKKINNINHLNGYDINKINHRGETEDPEIIYDDDIHYYGDLSYYDNYNAIERHIQPILFRFNTAQRESSQATASNDYFRSFIYDEIKQDDYDTKDFEVQGIDHNVCNNKMEGYYYIPHYEVKIKGFDKVQTLLPDFLTIRSFVKNQENNYTITTLEYHYLSPGDKSMIYDSENDKYYYCTTVTAKTDSPRVYTCNIFDENGEKATGLTADNVDDYKLFKIDNLGIPSYARILRDGTCRFIWRNILNNGETGIEESIEEYPFTNGAFYVNKRIDIYVRRQDPYNKYGLYAEDDIPGIETPIENINNYTNADEIEC